MPGGKRCRWSGRTQHQDRRQLVHLLEHSSCSSSWDRRKNKMAVTPAVFFIGRGPRRAEGLLPGAGPCRCTHAAPGALRDGPDGVMRRRVLGEWGCGESRGLRGHEPAYLRLRGHAPACFLNLLPIAFSPPLRSCARSPPATSKVTGAVRRAVSASISTSTA